MLCFFSRPRPASRLAPVALAGLVWLWTWAANQASAQEIGSMYLIDADLDANITKIEHAETYAIKSSIPVSELSVEAIFYDPAVLSVRFNLNGGTRVQEESAVPFSLCGDFKGDFKGDCDILLGRNDLSVVPYYEKKARGDPGPSMDVTFFIESGVRVIRLEWWSASTDEKVRNLATPGPDQILLPAGTSPSDINIRACTTLGSPVTSIQFVVNDGEAFFTDNTPSDGFFLFGASGDNVLPGTLDFGTWTIAALPDEGAPLTTTFTITAEEGTDEGVLGMTLWNVDGNVAIQELAPEISIHLDWDVPLDRLTVRATTAADVERIGWKVNDVWVGFSEAPHFLYGTSADGMPLAASSAAVRLVEGMNFLRANPDPGAVARWYVNITIDPPPPTGGVGGIDGDGSCMRAGDRFQWHQVILTCAGPWTSETADDPNPFTHYRFTVTFSHDQSGTTMVVPGFYAADGDAGQTGADAGNKWRVNFSPPLSGRWRYVTSFRTGAWIAISLEEEEGSSAGFFDGNIGDFWVYGPAAAQWATSLPDFRNRGHLSHVPGKHYFQFSGDNGYFLKGGTDSPENFLAFEGFDGTFDLGGIPTTNLPRGLHRYLPHVQNFVMDEDPTWRGDNRSQGIIGAINYLSSRGVNSIYAITYNIDGGDGMDVWPWTDPDERERFDCSKLDQWEIVINHMTKKGVMFHWLTQETENELLLGTPAYTSFWNRARQLYYRELMARFSHAPAMVINLGEENGNTMAQIDRMSNYLRDVDPYKHPLVLHTFFDESVTRYTNLINNAKTSAATLDGTSIQGRALNFNDEAATLRALSAEDGHMWAVMGDEQGPSVNPDAGPAQIRLLRKDGLWGNLLGGGAGIEWYHGYEGDWGDVQTEDFTRIENYWDQTSLAIAFFHKYLPFWRMEPRNDLVTAGTARVFAAESEIYCVQVTENDVSGVRLKLKPNSATFTLRWFDPRDVSNTALVTTNQRTRSGGNQIAVGSTPRDEPSNEEWIILITRDV